MNNDQLRGTKQEDEMVSTKQRKKEREKASKRDRERERVLG